MVMFSPLLIFYFHFTFIQRKGTICTAFTTGAYNINTMLQPRNNLSAYITVCANEISKL